jgi:hypothetical protein
MRDTETLIERACRRLLMEIFAGRRARHLHTSSLLSLVRTYWYVSCRMSGILNNRLLLSTTPNILGWYFSLIPAPTNNIVIVIHFLFHGPLYCHVILLLAPPSLARVNIALLLDLLVVFFFIRIQAHHTGSPAVLGTFTDGWGILFNVAGGGAERGKFTGGGAVLGKREASRG